MKILFNKLCVVGVLGLFMLQSCETTNLDLTKNPNALSPEQASPDFLLNGIQVQFARTVEGMGETAAQLTRIEYMFGRSYVNNYQPNSFDTNWEDTYTEMFTDINAMNPLAEEASLYHHLGMGQFIKAYMITTMVDFFGDVPYSQANQGAANFNPGVDSGASIYDAALALLDEAIANFNKTSAALPQNDFFYDGDGDAWVKACNTLKMRLYMNTRLVNTNALASFNSIVNSGNYISDTADDMEFGWGTNVTQPDNRHPRYGRNYAASGGAADYMSIDLMSYMDNNADPRIRYYFYRQNEFTPGQDGSEPALETLQCSLQEAPAHYAGFPFCGLPNGYWGRDHGNNEGTPPDGFLRTTVGVYPFGGKFDDSTFEGQLLGDGGGGAGVTPIMLASSSDFLIAEARMVAGNTAGAKAKVLEGLGKSVAKVVSFGSIDGSADLTFAPTQGDIDDHAALVDDAFDNDSEGGWNVLAREFFTSLFGNGLDSYNFYRRTGYPTDLQPNLEPQPGGFIRSFFYPANFVNNNSSVPQKGGVTNQVFWDTNPSSPGFPVSN